MTRFSEKWMLRACALSFFALPFVHNSAFAQCALGIYQSKPRSGEWNLSNSRLNFVAKTTLTLKPASATLVEIEEETKFDLSSAITILNGAVASSASAGLPRDDCDTIGILNGVRTGVEGGQIVTTVSFKGQKWSCPSAHVPCPTFQEPLRMCLKRLAQTIIGEGNGTVKVTITPTIANNDIVLTTSSSTDFQLTNETRIVGTIISGALGGAIGAGLFNSFASDMERQVKEFPVSTPAPQTISTSRQETPIYRPTMRAVEFQPDPSNPTGIILRMLRTSTYKTGTACFLACEITENCTRETSPSQNSAASTKVAAAAPSGQPIDKVRKQKPTVRPPTRLEGKRTVSVPKAKATKRKQSPPYRMSKKYRSFARYCWL